MLNNQQSENHAHSKINIPEVNFQIFFQTPCQLINPSLDGSALADLAHCWDSFNSRSPSAPGVFGGITLFLPLVVLYASTHGFHKFLIFSKL